MLLISAATTRAQVLELAKRSEALKMRGAVVGAWVHWIMQVHPELELKIDPAAMAQYENLNGVPEPLLSKVLYAEDEKEAADIAKVLSGDDRTGYANTRKGTAEDAAMDEPEPAPSAAGESARGDGPSVAPAAAGGGTPGASAGAPAASPSGSIPPVAAAVSASVPANHGASAASAAEGAAATAAPSEVDPQELPFIPMSDPSRGGAGVYMNGLDDYHLVQDLCPDIDIDAHAQSALLKRLARGGRLVIARGNTPASDYELDFFPLMFPYLFPYGDGGPRAGCLSFEAWVKLQLLRCVPELALGRGGRGRKASEGCLSSALRAWPAPFR